MDVRQREKPLGEDPALGRKPDHGTKYSAPKATRNFSLVMEFVTRGVFGGILVVTLESPIVGSDLGKTYHQGSLVFCFHKPLFSDIP